MNSKSKRTWPLWSLIACIIAAGCSSNSKAALSVQASSEVVRETVPKISLTSEESKTEEINDQIYYVPSNMKIREDASLNAGQTDSLTAGSYVEFKQVVEQDDQIWGQRWNDDWICIQNGEEQYLERFDLNNQTKVLENANFEDFVVEFSDGWLVLQNGFFGFLKPDGTYKIAPVKDEAVVYQNPQTGIWKGCIRNFKNNDPHELEEGTVTACSPDFTSGSTSRILIDENGELIKADLTIEKTEIPKKTVGTAGVGVLNQDRTLLYLTDSDTQTITEAMEADEPRTFRFIHPAYHSLFEPHQDSLWTRPSYVVALNGVLGTYDVDYPYYENNAGNAVLHGANGAVKSGYDLVRILSSNAAMVKEGDRISVLDSNLDVIASEECDFLSAPVDGKCLMRVGETWSMIELK